MAVHADGSIIFPIDGKFITESRDCIWYSLCIHAELVAEIFSESRSNTFEVGDEV